MFTMRRIFVALLSLVVLGAAAGLASARGGVPAVVGGGGVAPAPVAAVGGGGGHGIVVTSLMTPTTPFGPTNEEPTMPGAPLAAVGTLRFTAAQGIMRVDLVNMDPARFPNVGTPARGGGVAAAGPCLAKLSLGTSGIVVVPVTASVAPNVGSSVTLKQPATAATAKAAPATIDIVCTFVDPATKTTVTHQTHWTGHLP